MRQGSSICWQKRKKRSSKRTMMKKKTKTKEYVTYLTRCTKDLCNNSKGNSANGGGGDDGDKSHNGVVVPGRSKAALSVKSGNKGSLLALTSLCLSIYAFNAIHI